jgi:hypothetical protein
MDINKELYSIYSKDNNDIYKLAGEYNASKYYYENDELHYVNEMTGWPLFIKSNDEYEKADIKLLIFGRVQTGWIDSDENIYGVDDISVEDILNLYDGFFTNKNCYTLAKKGMFWRGIKNFIQKLEKNINNIKPNIKIDYLWNNVIKLGYYNSHDFPPAFYKDIVEPYLNKIILEEIKILQPHNIVFFTGGPGDKGKKYDEILENIFTHSESKSYKMIIPNLKEIKCFKTYYPPYHSQKNNEWYTNKYNNKCDRIINEIINDVKKMYGA